mmetsp:Transcript_20093/g.43830  ORF Transcript_20093/g.43830 Transcript_20093/m.43830 type:complete len:205 (+) Transcript_20093:3129-3743(+)
MNLERSIRRYHFFFLGLPRPLFLLLLGSFTEEALSALLFCVALEASRFLSISSVTCSSPNTSMTPSSLVGGFSISLKSSSSSCRIFCSSAVVQCFPLCTISSISISSLSSKPGPKYSCGLLAPPPDVEELATPYKGSDTTVESLRALLMSSAVSCSPPLSSRIKSSPSLPTPLPASLLFDFLASSRCARHRIKIAFSTILPMKS